MKCLVVEQSAKDRADARRILEQLGLEVIEHLSGEFAVQVLRPEDMPDVVLVGELNGQMNATAFIRLISALSGKKPKVLRWIDEANAIHLGKTTRLGDFELVHVKKPPEEKNVDAVILKPLDRVEVFLRFHEVGLRLS